MNRTERLYRIDQLISEHGVVSRQSLLDELEVSLATLKRDLEYLRERLNAPIVWDRDAGGYRFARGPQVGAQYELPGLWFSDREIHALLTMQHLLANLDPGGILAPHVQPLMARLNALLGTADDAAEEVRRRVLIVGIGKRTMKLDHFEHIGSALLRRKRLSMRYYARGTDEETEREISPQRLVHYRENWYLDAWCHLRRDVRNFAVDSIRQVRVLERPAREVSGKTLDTVLGPGYGIFSGRKLQIATLRFTPERARWVAAEHWHPKQRGHFDEHGHYLLEFPYADHRELLMDILKHGRHCEVVGPEELRDAVLGEVFAMQRGYAG
ncbi:MAG: YafY family transcriptional regulator [Azoarcus sp.]|nr:YafY family transcriptional regulator [Azoarcus sp.]